MDVLQVHIRECKPGSWLSIACAACDSERDSGGRSGGTSEGESELESEDSEEGSDLEETRGEPAELESNDSEEESDLKEARSGLGAAAFNVLKDWCGSAQSLVA